MTIDSPVHRAWLTEHTLGLLEFGRRTPGPRGAQWLDETGAPDLGRPVLTWITCRTTHVYALGAMLGVPGARPVAQASLDALAGALHDDDHGGWYTSVGPGDGEVDGTKSAYAHAFVVLAASSACAAGLDGARVLLDEALATLDARFFEAEHGMHADEWDPAWTRCDPYRGVNANMHAVEALLAAADVTGEVRWRERALGITERVLAWASAHDWRIPEHFDAAWRPQLMLNVEAPEDPFEPFGATVGHGLEWARLASHLAAALGARTDLVDAARHLYGRAVADGWDAGAPTPGFVYTTDWKGAPVVRARMHWVAAEAIGAAAALLRATGDTAYAQDYARWWDHAATVLIDHTHGSWHHEVDDHGRPDAGVWPGKPDLYHAMGAVLVPRLPLAPAMAVAVRDGLLDRP